MKAIELMDLFDIIQRTAQTNVALFGEREKD